MPIPLVIKKFPPISVTTLEMMGYILSVNMSSSEKMRELTELSTITDDSSDSKPTYSEDDNLEDSMWHIPSFEILQKTKGLFWWGLWEASFLSSN